MLRSVGIERKNSVPPTPTPPKPKVLKNPAVRLLRADPYQIIYSNNAQISMSPFDLRIDFGETTSIAEDVVTVTQKVQIVMSPQHAVALLQALRSALDMAKSLNESGSTSGDRKQ